ncbi:MAG: hypothetical protein IOC90_14715 [Methylocystis sp.]|nr:hypothetical protein [Methylocystis sp.]MCA3584785.1 hypothetical protein [Methylocystis sp.]MCA3589266.1 hypothetical protein [Methylocystis sp.]MCA3593222.1 hypothetical protein [Methylocystis sp.]
MIGYFRRISEERYRRAQRRRRTEEIMGWICVPVILVIGWYGWKGWEHVVADRQTPNREQVTPATLGSAPLRR